MILSTLVQSWNWLSIKFMYIYNPDFNGFQIIFGRSLFAILVLVLTLNKNLKDIMITSVPEGSTKLLILRIILGLFGISTMLHITKWFSLTTITVINGLNPVFTMIIGVFYLGESITKLDVIFILFSFLGVILMTLGLVTNSEEDYLENE